MSQPTRSISATTVSERGSLPRFEQVTVHAEIGVAAATVQLVDFQLPSPIDCILHKPVDKEYWLDLCLTPRPENACGCYSDHWPPLHFERLGKVFAVPPGETFRARSDSGRQTSLVCKLRPEPIRSWFDGDLQWTPRRLEASLDIPDENIRNMLRRLAEEVLRPGFAAEVIVELAALQLAFELCRYCNAIGEGPVAGGLAPWRMRRIDERLREVRKPPTLAELASLCRLSVRQLTRAFRASRGISIGDYVARTRIEHAQRLLATDRSIKAIAESLGFSSRSAFSYAFHRDTGESPRKFRQRLPEGSLARG